MPFALAPAPALKRITVVADRIIKYQSNYMQRYPHAISFNDNTVCFQLNCHFATQGSRGCAGGENTPQP